jgi:ABC-type dipeptide/oligopeptide/nickel transport system permease subunit
MEVAVTLSSGDLIEQESALTRDEPQDVARPVKQFAGRSPTQIALERLRKDPVAVISFILVLLFALVAVGAPLWCNLLGVSTDTVQASTRIDLVTGLPLKGPPHHGWEASHPFGVAPATGNDNLAWWMYGCRTSLFLATIATVLSTVIGVVLGLIAGYAGGIVDSVIGFFTDFFLTFPFLLAALAISPILQDRFGTNIDLYNELTFWTLVGILVIFGWMGMTRLIRGEVLSLREREFVKAARVLGVPTHKILFKEILPNLIAPIVVSISLGLPAFVAAEAGLSFLGIGVQGRPSWGQTIDGATKYWETYPLYLWEPVIGITVLVVALNLLGDAIRDAFDPKTRR